MPVLAIGFHFSYFHFFTR